MSNLTEMLTTLLRTVVPNVGSLLPEGNFWFLGDDRKSVVGH